MISRSQARIAKATLYFNRDSTPRVMDLTAKKIIGCPNCKSKVSIDSGFKGDLLCNKCGYVMRERY